MLFDRLMGCDIILCGDFNCPGMDCCSIDTRLDRVKSDYNLTQHVNCPTHIDANMLDLLFTIDARPAISNVRVADVGFDDHYLVSCDVAVSQIKGESNKNMIRRSLDKLDKSKFMSRLDVLMADAPMTDNVNT